MEAICAVVEEVSAACASTGAILAAHALGAVPVRIAGTDEQRREAFEGNTEGWEVQLGNVAKYSERVSA